MRIDLNLPDLRRAHPNGCARQLILATLLALTLPGLAPVARAAEPADAAPAADAETSVQEVVVTANKLNARNVLDVPISIQAISGDSLRAAGSSGFLDIANKIPGLAIEDQGLGDRKYVIRGINSTGDATAGIYYDEAVISGSNANDGGGLQSDIKLYDLDHIEVLRGPQGTLYGASSMSGTIRFVTRKPDLNNFGGYAAAEISGTEHGGGNNAVNGAINLPIIDGQLALRAVGWSLNDSGYIDQLRVGTIGLVRGVNDDDARGGRVSLRYQPFDDLTLDATYTSQTESSNGSARYTPAGQTSTGTPGTGFEGCDLCNTDVNFSPSEDKLQVYSLTGTYKFQYGTITATTNQYNRSFTLWFDTSVGLEVFGIPFPTESIEPQQRDLNSSEIRYASNFDFPVNFVTGIYRQHESNDLSVESVKTNGLGVPAGPFSSSNSDDALSNPNGNTVFGRDDDRRTTQWAGFGEATWKVTPKLSVVGGVRYFTETLDGIQVQTHPFGGFVGGGNVAPIIDPTEKFSKTTFKFNVSYDFSPSLLAYALASSGFRSGGLNTESEPFEPIPGSFRPDSLWNYEAGAKGRLFEGRLDYQLDAYVIMWHDIQVRETTADGSFNFIGNAGDAIVKGMEFEFDAHPIESVTASIAGSYQDAHLQHGATAEQFAGNPTLGLTGGTIPEVPRFQFSAELKYTHALTDRLIGEGAADLNYRGHTNSSFATDPFNVPLGSYSLLNLRAGLSSGPWTANVFVRNATNKRAEISALVSQGNPLQLFTVRPRTIGVNVTRTF
ncbi:MAG TPA: TonB-dependent receptor [Steroidobacteraceae bacterium]|jgi:outer membrane receptor protein involved in Fe transport